MTKRERYDKALGIINARRQYARQEQKRRREQAVKKVPRIIALEHAMSQSAVELSKLILAKEADASHIIPQIMQKNLEAQAEIVRLLKEAGFPEDYLETKYRCCKCEDTGFVDGRRCECLEAVLKKLAIDEFNQSTTMSLMTFDDFKLHYYDAVKKGANGRTDFETMSQILRFCQSYAKGFSKDSPSILMMGNTGLGKTHLSLAIAHEVIQNGFTVLYGTAQELFQKIQNEFFGKNKNGEDTTAAVLDADLLILDDLGAEFESNFHVSAFYNLLNGRLNSGKPTIINTNLTAQELEARYTNRSASRLLTLYKCLKFVGTDVRQQKLSGK